MKNFKNASGVWLTKQLFYEFADTDRSRCLYTLKDEDHPGTFLNSSGDIEDKIFPSLRRLYLEMGDESEYDFANEYFGGWPHWKRLLSCNWFMDYLSSFREELQVQNQAEALRVLRAASKSGHTPTARYLLERGWTKESPGRPTKERIKREASLLQQDSNFVSDDLERILQ